MKNLQSYQSYLAQWKEIQKLFLLYIEDDKTENEQFQNIIAFLDTMNVKEDPYKLKTALHLLLKIHKNHYYTTSLNSKTMKIISNYKEQILQFYSQDEIYQMFMKNKSIFLFVLQEKIVIPSMNNVPFIPKDKYQFASYIQFFYPDFYPYYLDCTKNLCQDSDEFSRNCDDFFLQKRQVGQNPAVICEIIRNDSIDDFIRFINTNGVTIGKNDVRYSIFETNIFLYQSKVTLLDYAAFFGAIQIFTYLLLNGCNLRDETWFFAIHGNNTEIIRILEDKQLLPPDNDYVRCLIEAVKCHHNDLARYFYSNYLDDNGDLLTIMQIQAIDSFNFEFFPEILNSDPKFLYEFCKKDYYEIVKVLLENNKYDLNQLIICIEFH